MDSERKQRIREMRVICAPNEAEYRTPVIQRLYIVIGFSFTRLLVKTRITPNQITGIWGTMMVLLSLLYLFDRPLLYVIGAVGWIFAYSLDGTDGHVARYKKMCSKRGVFLDLVNHYVTWPLLFFCVGMGQFMMSGEICDIVFGTVAGVSVLLLMVIQYVYNVINPGVYKKGESDLEIDRNLFKSDRTRKAIENINPLLFPNIPLMLLIASTLDLMVSELALPGLIFGDQLLWMTSFLSIFIFIYAVGYVLSSAMKITILYRSLQ